MVIRAKKSLEITNHLAEFMSEGRSVPPLTHQVSVFLKPMSFGIGTDQIYVSANLKITVYNGFWDHLWIIETKNVEFLNAKDAMY